jgi:hypothetical protein
VKRASSWEVDQGAASEMGEERTSAETKWESDILFKRGIYDICKGGRKRLCRVRGGRRRWLWLRIKKIFKRELLPAMHVFGRITYFRRQV